VRLPLWAVIPLALLKTACTGNSPSEGFSDVAPAVIEVPQVAERIGNAEFLKTVGPGVDACAALTTEIQAMAEWHIRKTFAAYRLPDVRARSDGDAFGVPLPFSGGASASATSSVPASVGSHYSSDWNRSKGFQALGEIKDDGQHLWILSDIADGFQLTQTSLVPASPMRRVAQITFPKKVVENNLPLRFRAEGLLQLPDQKNLVVLTQEYDDGPSNEIKPAGGASTSLTARAGLQTKLIVTQTVASNMTVARARTVPGHVVAAHHLRKNNSVLLVTRAPLYWPEKILWTVPLRPGIKQIEVNQEWLALFNQTLAENLNIVKATPLEGWLGQATPPSPSECAQFVATSTPNRPSLTRIAIFDANLNIQSEKVLLNESGLAYLSAESLYLTTVRGGDVTQVSSPIYYTDLHRVGLAEDGALSFDASGSFRGYLIGNSLDETQISGRRVLRLALGDYSDDGSSPSSIFGHLFTLVQQGSQLKVLAKSGKIANARGIGGLYISGDLGYVVPNQPGDPHLLFDLSDPENLTRKTELTSRPGSFSLYSISPTLWIIVESGFDVQTSLLRATLFDMTSPASPKELSKRVLPLTANAVQGATFFQTQNGQSPGTTWIGVPNGGNLKVLSVTGADGIQDRGSLSGVDCCMLQAIFIDDTVYGLSYEHVVAAKLDQPTMRLGSVVISP
jgi:Beta propeller domain